MYLLGKRKIKRNTFSKKIWRDIVEFECDLTLFTKCLNTFQEKVALKQRGEKQTTNKTKQRTNQH